jgi:hypothetical protein
MTMKIKRVLLLDLEDKCEPSALLLWGGSVFFKDITFGILFCSSEDDFVPDR